MKCKTIANTYENNIFPTHYWVLVTLPQNHYLHYFTVYVVTEVLNVNFALLKPFNYTVLIFF